LAIVTFIAENIGYGNSLRARKAIAAIPTKALSRFGGNFHETFNLSCRKLPRILPHPQVFFQFIQSHHAWNGTGDVRVGENVSEGDLSG
jgi:hypothetical protein